MRRWIPGGLVLALACGDTPMDVENQPPTAHNDIADVSLLQGEMRQWPLASHFTDPDGDPLNYTAESSDARSVLASISDDNSLLVVEAREPPGAQITITATDTTGASAFIEFQVKVSRQIIDEFRDDFSSIGDWQGYHSVSPNSAVASVVDGKMRIQVLESPGHYFAAYELEGYMGPGWEVTTRFTRTDGVCASMMLFPEPIVPEVLPALVGKFQWSEDNTWYVAFFLGASNSWLELEGPVIPGAVVGEYLEATVGVADGHIYARAGVYELFSEPLPEDLPQDPAMMRTVGVAGYNCGSEGTVTFDWLEAKRRT